MKTVQDAVNRLSHGIEDRIIDRDIALRTVNVPLYLNWLKGQNRCKRAQSKPLPGNLLGAFMDGSIEVLGKHVCRIVPAHFFILQKIQSKLLNLLSQAEDNGKANTGMDTQEEWDVCWIFTNEPERIFDLVANGGIKALRDDYGKTIALTWPPEAIEAVVLAVIEQLKRHAENKVKLISDMKREGNITFFQEPEPTPATNQQATDGSLPTSANIAATSPANPGTK